MPIPPIVGPDACGANAICDSWGAPAISATQNILLANCGQCHGPYGNDSGGIDYINDIDQLVVAGLIVPLDSGASPIVRVMFDGSMPPPSSGLPPVTEADITTVAQYIDNPRFWPGQATSPAAAVDAGSPAPLLDAGVDGG